MSLHDQISVLRNDIKAKTAELVALKAQPRSRAQVAALAAEVVAKCAATGGDQMRQAVECLAAGQHAGLFTVTGSAMTVHGPVTLNIDLGPVLAHLLGAKVMRSALQTALTNIPEGLDPAARVERTAAIELELEDLQTAEERLIREAAHVGQDIPRRHDAAARIVLACET